MMLVAGVACGSGEGQMGNPPVHTEELPDLFVALSVVF